MGVRVWLWGMLRRRMLSEFCFSLHEMFSSLRFDFDLVFSGWFCGNSNSDINRPISAGSIPGPVSGLKLVSTGVGTWGYAFTGSAAPNGTIYNSALVETPLSSGMMYTKIFVRHWDSCKCPFFLLFHNIADSHRCHALQKQCLVWNTLFSEY